MLENPPDDATWDDVGYELAVRRSIERGINDAEAGRLTDLGDAPRELSLE